MGEILGLAKAAGAAAGAAKTIGQPGGILREMGSRFGDNPIGKVAGTIGEAFDPVGGKFDVGALLDEKRLKENQMLRKEIGGMQDKGGDHWVMLLAQRLAEMGKKDG